MVALGFSLQDQPSLLRLSSALPFVGRSAELEQLRTLLPAARGESLRVVLIGGEAGSGKSRLVREFATSAIADGVLVLYGACDAVVQAPYGPFAEALERLPEAVEGDRLTAAIGSGAVELSRLVPDLVNERPRTPAPAVADPDTERHRLHTAVGDVLEFLGGDRPGLVVIEDAHW